MARTETPETPQALLMRLNDIFPEFQLKAIDDPEWWEAQSFHSIMSEFLSYFAKQAPTASERQLQALGRLLASALSIPGRLENAIDTCFLEHLRQVRAEKYLRRHLAAGERELKRHA